MAGAFRRHKHGTDNNKVEGKLSGSHQRAWWVRQCQVRWIKFQHRTLSQEICTDTPTSSVDTLVFEGGLEPHHDFPLPSSGSLSGPAVLASVYLRRKERADALRHTADMASLFGYSEAYEQERGKKWAKEWDSIFHFESENPRSWRLLVETYASPEFFDRILILPLEQSYLQLNVQIGVLSPVSELARDGPHDASSKGILPPPSTNINGDHPLQTTTAGQLLAISLIQGRQTAP